MWFSHSLGLNWSRSEPIFRQTASLLRSAALRRRCLSFANTCSMGFRSGEQAGRKKSLVPAALMALRMAGAL